MAMKNTLFITLLLALGAFVFFMYSNVQHTDALENVTIEVLELNTTPVDTTVKQLFTTRCMPCHGKDAKGQALSTSDVISHWNEKKIQMALLGYKEGTRDSKGLGSMMHAQTRDLNRSQIHQLANYIASQR